MKFIPVNEPLLTGNEKKYLNDCIDTGWISSEGPYITRFEDEFAARMGRKFGVAVCNGSVAIDAAVLALGIKEGDEVIMPTFTIISCAAAIIRAGATPVLVDAEPITWNMDVNQVASKITSRTKAIMVVHIYGLPVDMNPILELAEKHNLKIIEDAAEMHGQTYYGKPCGSFGQISTFSFYANKNITTGEGGMILTDDEQIAEKCRSLRNLCFVPKKRFVHDELGFNFRMTNLQGAVGLAQLERIDDIVKRKREIGALYNQLLANVDGITLPSASTLYADNIYWVYGLVLKPETGLNAETAMAKLMAEQIGTRPFFWPMHEQPVLHKMGLFKNLHFPVAENIARMGFYLPSGMALTNAQIQTVAGKLKQILAKN